MKANQRFRFDLQRFAEEPPEAEPAEPEPIAEAVEAAAEAVAETSATAA